MTEAVAKYGEGLPAKLTDEAIARTLENMQQWEKFKKQALSAKDKTLFGDNEYVEKSGWVKLAMALNVSFQIFRNANGQPAGERVVGRDNEGEYYTWIFGGRATMPNGRSVEMDGACSSRDKFFSMMTDADGSPIRRNPSDIDEKDIIATAQTNCFNRCMAFLCGFGEVSADEIKGKQFERKPIMFPFGEFKGKQPGDLTLDHLHKLLPFWQKQADDPGNKFAAQNKKLVAAIQEAIAEKTAKPKSPARQAAEADPGVKDAAATPAGDISPLEKEWAAVHDAFEARGFTKGGVAVMIRTWRDKNFPGVKFSDLSLLQVQALRAYVSTLERPESGEAA